MIDVRLLRDDPEVLRDSLKRRGSSIDLDGLVALEAQHRGLLGEVEAARAEQNKASRLVSQSSEDARESAIAKGRELADNVKQLEARLDELASDLDSRLAHFPNLLHPDAPEGTGDESNVIVREVGTPRSFDFDAVDHLELGEQLDILDVVRAAKVSGPRFGFLKGEAALLELSLVRYAMDLLVAEGFVPIVPPALVKQEAMYGTGFFPTDEAQVYKIPEDDLYLAGTSEVPLAGMHAGEILDPADLPIRYAGFSTCFRREAGTYGKDTKGIIRVHQFDKVEMFVFCSADESQDWHARILDYEERFFQSLNIPYRVVEICAGDLAAPNYRKFDIEAWLPGDKRWLEVTSCSNDIDYQARRLSVRSKGKDGNTLVHTLNGTMVAIQRTIVALMENNQEADGSITMPEEIRPYTGFDSIKSASSGK